MKKSAFSVEPPTVTKVDFIYPSPELSLTPEPLSAETVKFAMSIVTYTILEL